MSRRHNRKRTRSRPRNRSNDNVQHQNHARSISVSTVSTSSSLTPPPYTTQHYPSITTAANMPANHWHQTYFAWQTRARLESERARELEAARMRIFGGEEGDEVSLLEPMLKVVTDLFDGFTDYEDP